MPQPNDLSRSLVALDQDSTIIAVVEMSQADDTAQRGQMSISRGRRRGRRCPGRDGRRRHPPRRQACKVWFLPERHLATVI